MTHKITAIAASIALAISGMAVPAFAGNEGQVGTGSASDEQAVCKAILDANPNAFASVGDCVSYIRTFYVEACKQLKDNGSFPLDLGNGTVLKNQGDCIAYTRHFGT